MLVPLKPAEKRDKQPVQDLEVKGVEGFTKILGLPDIRVSEAKFLQGKKGEKSLHLICKPLCDCALCPRCGRMTNKMYENNKERVVRDLDWGGNRVYLHIPVRRFDCEECEKPFTELWQSIERSRRATVRFERMLYNRCKEATVKSVAHDVGLSENCVREIFKRWAKRACREQIRPRTREIGIDEISIHKGHKNFILVISDLVRRCIIAVLPTRSKEELDSWFAKLSPKQRRDIQVVSVDMWKPYHSSVKQYLPHVTIVVDRFHVMKQLNHQLNLLRRRIQKDASKEDKDILKGCRWILLKNLEDLSKQELEQLQRIFEVAHELHQAYLLKEEFRNIFEKIQDRKRAEAFLHSWLFKAILLDNSFLNAFVKTLRNWWIPILNYFIDRVTNGFVEGSNRAIRSIIWRAYGFRSFQNLKLHILAKYDPLPQ